MASPLRWLLGALLSLVSAACVLSVEPIYLSEDLLFDPALLGEWGPVKAGGVDRAVITRTDTLEYAVAYTAEDGRQGRFVGHLARVGGILLLDLLPVPLQEGNDAYRGRFIPTHLILRIDRITPTLRYRYLNVDSLRRRFDKIPGLRGFEDKDDQLVLTTGTRELQRLLTSRTIPDRVLWTRVVEVARPTTTSRSARRSPNN